MEVSKALFISQEINPYLSPTTMSVLCRTVPQKLQEGGTEVRTFMPKYGCINERRNQLHEVIRLSGLNIIIDDTDHPLIIKVATLQPTRMQVYFIDSDDFFHHQASQQLETATDAHDNDERMIFFTLGVVETVRKLRWYPTLIQCSGWMTALIPMVIKIKYPDDPAFKNAKVVYSLFGDTVAQPLDARMPEKLRADGYADDDMRALLDEVIDTAAINRLGIDYADAIVQATDDVDPAVIEYARSTGKPFLQYPGADDLTAYAEFYRSL